MAVSMPLLPKYYELEQYEEVLARAKYQWQGKESKSQMEQYSFMQDQKLLDALEIDYDNKTAKVVKGLKT